MELSERDITYLPGVGPKRAEILKKELNIHSAEELLCYFPYRYIDRSRIFKIREIDGNMPFIQLKGNIVSFDTIGEGAARRLVARFTDGTGYIELVWFKAIKYMLNLYKVNTEYIVFGKPTQFGSRFSIAHPEIDSSKDQAELGAGLSGFYNTSEKMKNNTLNSKAIQKIIHGIISSSADTIRETLTPELINRTKVISRKDALVNIHQPQTTEMIRQAEYRLKFEELFYLQLNIQRYAQQRKQQQGGLIFHTIGQHFNSFYNQNLPFELTGAQKRVLKEIRNDLRSGRQMNRLLQGDVGSGKTLVGLMAMLMALDNGFQACMMAPTEILATQHYEGISKFLQGLPITCELLTGSTRKKNREHIHEKLQNGELHILIGTHALIEDTVQFKNLGIAIIDEQHRFGVEQRSKLWRKNHTPPHILVMTATPIPRTLAMTVYGDLDVSVIDELPPGRKPIQTIHQYDNRRTSLYESMRKQLNEGRQVYIVYPLIQESEKMDLKNVEEGFDHIQQLFPEYRVCMVHGKMKPAVKDEAMQRFIKNEAQIMVATTVIEVGVNVPNATVMVIENAERFGLSQLHQLRGRVGRGGDQSYCILVTGFKLSDDTRKRMEIMVATTDGFEISEADLKLRGPGDLEGTQQSGVAFDLKIANLAKDGQIVQLARDLALEVLESDPTLTQNNNDILRRQLNKLFNKKLNWGLIS
ncbi:MAG: ATP-dependent DNA helicase RecG [Bacteroidales bacterium]